ncbi:hypothetical protein GCM10028801_37490 [Nocardioides maradonensis]
MRRPIAAAGPRLAAAIALAVSVLTCGPAVAATSGATAAAVCAGVVVVVDFNELGGGEKTACAPHGGTASGVFAEAGVRLAYQPGMPDFVCTVDRLPDDRPCTTGTSYWSLWWSPSGAGWTYAALGVGSLEINKGDAVGFVWHQGKAPARPPAFDLGTSSPSAGHLVPPDPADHSNAGPGTWIAVGLGVLVIGGAAAVPLLRRRRG